jgi:hypothetical protein
LGVSAATAYLQYVFLYPKMNMYQNTSRNAAHAATVLS